MCRGVTRLFALLLLAGSFSFAAFAATPTLGTITPASGTSAPNTAINFTCTHNDADGYADIKDTKLLMATATTPLANTVEAYYDPTANKLYLRDDGDANWLGGFAPGSSNVIENSQAKLDCSTTTVSSTTTALTVNYNLTIKPAYSGKAHNTYLYVKDATKSAGWTKKGTYTINSVPTITSLTPSAVAATPNVYYNLAAAFDDADGYQNIQYVYTIINTSASGTNAPYLYYNQTTNLLYLRNDANNAWLGGFAPGSANVLENNSCKLDCSATTVSGNGTALTVNWAIAVKPVLVGNKNIYLYVKDKLNAYVNYTNMGTWSVANHAPTLGAITPASGTVAPGVAKTFTTLYSDPDGYTDIKDVKLIVGPDATTLANNVQLYYNQQENKLYLRDDTNGTWLGGFAPGSGNTIENSQCALDCSQTTVSGSDTTLTVGWNITFKPAYSGKAYNTYLYVADSYGVATAWTRKGTYSISSTPVPVSITPSSGSGVAETPQLFSSVVSDADGWQNIQLVYFIINTSASAANGFEGYYDQKNNLLYMRDDAGTAWLGGFAPGSANVIENSFTKLDCSQTTISGDGSNLTINWAVTTKAPFTGDKKLYLYVKDNQNLYTNWTQKGTWNIPNSAPINASILPASGQSTINQETVFTATYTDSDSYRNIQLAYLLFNSKLSTTGGVYVYYNPLTNKLYLRNDANNAWLGGFLPGSANVIENSSAKLNCANTIITGSGNNLVVQYALTFKDIFTGSKNIYMYVKDLASAVANWVQKGTWTVSADIAPAAPTGLTATAGDAIVNLSWTANTESDLVGYNIYRSTTPGSGYTKVNTQLVAAVSYQDANLTNNTNYYYVITAVDAVGNESVKSAEIAVKPVALITNLSVSNNAFSPNGDNAYDTTTISYNLTQNAPSVNLKIYDSQNNLVRTLFDGVAQNSGVNTAVWDGKNDSGTVLNDGMYTYKITVLDANGFSLALAASGIAVDNHWITILPPGIINGMVDLRVQNSQYVTGSRSVAIYMCPSGTSNWQQITSSWDTTTVINGNYDIKVYGYFFTLNGKEQGLWTVPVTYTVTNPLVISNVLASPNGFSPNGDHISDTTTINYTLTANASAVTVKLYDIQNNLVRTLLDGVAQNSGAKTVAWDGKNDSGQILSDGFYACKIDATDSSGNAAQEKQTNIAIDNHYMAIIGPVGGSNLAGVTDFILKPSPYVGTMFRYFDFCYRLSGATNWSVIGTPERQSDGTYKISWNTANVPNGNYEFYATSRFIDLNGVEQTGSTVVVACAVANNLTISNLSVSNNAFIPNYAGGYNTTTLGYNLTQNSPSVTIKVYDSQNNLVRTLQDAVAKNAGTNAIVWDGKNDSGTVLSDGMYTCKFNAVDASGNSAAEQSINVAINDNFLTLVSPAQGVISGSVNLAFKLSQYMSWARSAVIYYTVSGTSDWQGCNTNYQNDGTIIAPVDTTTLVNGNYDVKVHAIYTTINGKEQWLDTNPITFTVTNPLVVSNVLASPNGFSPNGDHISDTTTINYTLTANASVVMVKLYDAQSNLVRTLLDGVAQNSGAKTVAWDGKNDSGQILSDGVYTCKIDATDSSGNAAQEKQTNIVIDNHYMAIIGPVGGSNLSGVTDFILKPSPYVGTMFRYFDFCYRLSGATNWSVIGTPVRQSDGTYKISWNTATVPNGNYEFYATSRFIDLNGVEQTGSTVVVVCAVVNDCANINNLAVAPNPFSPDGSGTWVNTQTGEVFNDPAPGLVLDDQAAISFDVDRQAYVGVKVVDVSNQLVRQLVSSVLPIDGNNHIQLIWNGKDDAGNVVKNGQYKVIVDGVSAEKEQSTNVTVDKLSFVTNLAVTPNPFSPNNDGQNDATTLSYTISEKAYVDVEIYRDSTLIKKVVDNDLEDSGTHTYIWDGKDASGDLVPQGKYTFKIVTRAEAGNTGVPSFIDAWVSLVSNIHVSNDQLNPYTGGQVTLSYRADAPAILTIKVYDNANAVVRTLISNVQHSPGEYSQIWDGKDDNGNILLDGNYLFVFTDTITGSVQTAYDPRGTDGYDMSKNISFSVSKFNPTINKYCVLSYNQPKAAYITLKMRSDRLNGPALKTIKHLEPSETGQHVALWDGRDESGNFVGPRTNLFFALFGYTMADNSVVITGGKPSLSNLSLLPVRFSPYNYDYASSTAQNVTIAFDLSKPANVFVDIYNASGILVRTLANDVSSQAGTNSFIWDGKNNQGTYVTDGFYRVVVQAHCGDNYSDPIILHNEVYY